MAKVLTFSTTFPPYHSKAGKPTNFVESILNTLGIDRTSEEYLRFLIDANPHIPDQDVIKRFFFGLDESVDSLKPHTIRQGCRFTDGEESSPRIWSGKPYNSKQLTFAPDTVIQTVTAIEITSNVCIWKQGAPILRRDVALNDGLSEQDFKEWFEKPLRKKTYEKFSIYCWDENVNY